MVQPRVWMHSAILALIFVPQPTRAEEVIDLDETSEPEPVILEEDPSAEDDFGFDDSSSAASSEGDESNVKPSPLDMTLGLGVVSRNLHYVDSGASLAINSDLPVADNTMAAAFLPALSGHWYPMAHSSSGALAHLGLGFAFARGLPQKTEYTLAASPAPVDATYSQTFQAYSLGLRARVPISILTLGVEANYGSQSLWVRAKSENADTQIFPDVNYSYVEGRLDGTLTIKQISIGGYMGFRYALGMGEIRDDDWFENAKAIGLSYGGEFGYSVAPAWTLVAGVDAVSYRLNFNPLDPVTAPRVAGGASDRYLSAWAGVRFTWLNDSGVAASGTTSEEEESSGESEGGFDSFD